MSQASGLSFCQGKRVKPSGHLLSDIERPFGSFFIITICYIILVLYTPKASCIQFRDWLLDIVLDTNGISVVHINHAIVPLHILPHVTVSFEQFFCTYTLCYDVIWKSSTVLHMCVTILFGTVLLYIMLCVTILFFIMNEVALLLSPH